MSEIPKAYEPQSVEDKWYDFWLKHGCFTADPARVSEKRPAYSIVIPPPNVTGVLHMGHVLNNTVQDILARKARMDGKEVLWLPGTDHAGIATEAVVLRTLRKEGVIKHREDISREQFLEHVWAWKEKHGGIIIEQLKKLGCSCDWTRLRFTMDPEYSRCVQKVFVDLYKKGLIYRGKRMVNWDPAARTALSDEEVEMIEEKGHLWHIKYPLLDERGQPKADEFVIVATTRPETMLGDEAVAVNPKDERYAQLVERRCLLPLQSKPIPIIADDAVDPKFGTGCVKVTPAHDPADYEIALRHNLPLTIVIAPDGTMTQEAGGGFAGLDRMEARKAVVEHLERQGLLVKVEDYVHNVGYSQRSHVPIEPYLSEQWFLKYPGVEPSTKAVEDGRIQFHPDRWAKTYAHWMTNLRDWCISRQLWWGHRVPVWYRSKWLPTAAKSVKVVREDWNAISGKNAREIRDNAWTYAREHGFINSDFPNLDAGFDITVQQSSLEHAFSNRGLANIKLVPALPRLLRHAVLVETLPHNPPAREIVCVHTFYAALHLGHTLFRVKFTVKEFRSRLRLYDHQTVEVQKTEADGKYPPEEASVAGSFAPWPASVSEIKMSDLLSGVKPDFNWMRCQIESPGPGWQQDPDVLDTWASSWLWPFATMGWPEQTPTLQKFYPTTDLVTAPEIIFFWVARMIMAGFEYMGDLPFRNVYFTGIIRDKQGRKMSKSLGNSPDPLDLIAKYGADAVRFGTMRSAPLGQDVMFDEKDVELGRNFCNKLWNACRFRQMQGSAGAPPAAPGALPDASDVEGEIDPALLTSDDKWILVKLDRAIREIDAAFAEYRFNEVTQTLYRFFWSEYCDWYVEASKAVFQRPAEPLNREPVESGTPSPAERSAIAQGPAAAADSTIQRFNDSTSTALRTNKLAVIDFLLSRMLRLFHPFLPFITEELWHGMGFHADLPADQGGDTIMFARWPKPLDDDFKAHYGLSEADEKFVEQKYELVGQGRNLRREFNIPANKKAKFVLKPANELPAHEAAVLRILLNADPLEVDPNFQPPKGTPTVRSPLGELSLPLEGLIDLAAEKARLQKERTKIEAEIGKAQQKLNNPAFTGKAPAHVLEEQRKRLADWQEKLQHVQSALKALGEG